MVLLATNFWRILLEKVPRAPRRIPYEYLEPVEIDIDITSEPIIIERTSRY